MQNLRVFLFSCPESYFTERFTIHLTESFTVVVEMGERPRPVPVNLTRKTA